MVGPNRSRVNGGDSELPFTPRVHRVLSYAREEASRRGGSSVGTLDVLTGFAQEGHGLLVRLFASWHLSFDALCQELGTSPLPPPRMVAKGPTPVLEPDAELQRALVHAADEAAAMGRRRIENVHLLLGILRVDDCAASRLLAGKGMHADAVRARVAALTSLK